ncbi:MULTISPECIES: DUF5958 family protein [unclassified Streptomyces]|uniref:DUF5958 family protein n=1 Tax=Streptomyces sp. DH12 TaxID=2857010 RepID=UPI001E446C55|nr:MULTISPECIES: DUF5958 family protein [unclassified Streptomyces]
MVRRSQPGERFETLLFLRHHCIQARAVIQDGPESISRAGLRVTHTPAVLVTRGRSTSSWERSLNDVA